MYSNQLAVAIKTAGKVLREQGDKVFLPFGSEYSIFVKNLNTVRALVRISIDGQSVTDGEDLVVHGNSELDLERFLRAGNLDRGNRFKFIERTSRVEQHRGIGVEDGIVRVEFQFEKIPPKVTHTHEYHHHHDYYDWYPPYPPYRPQIWFGSGSTSSLSNNYDSTLIGANSAQASSLVRSKSASAVPMKCATGQSRAFVNQVQAQAVNDAGITVAGSESSQQFRTVSSFPVEDQKYVICLKLLGETDGQVVEQPVLVKKKQVCTTCGTRNRGKNVFCRHCGTKLEVVGQ